MCKPLPSALCLHQTDNGAKTTPEEQNHTKGKEHKLNIPKKLGEIVNSVKTEKYN